MVDCDVRWCDPSEPLRDARPVHRGVHAVTAGGTAEPLATDSAPPRMSGDERKSHILETALTLFSEKSYDGVSLQEIADRVGILKGSVYYYYRSKEDLLADALGQVRAEYRESVTLAADGPGNPISQLVRLIERKALFMCANAARAGVLLCETGALPEPRRAEHAADLAAEEARLRELLGAARASGQIAETTDPALAALWIVGMVNWIYRWYRANGPYAAPQIAAMTAEFAMRGLRDRSGPVQAAVAALNLPAPGESGAAAVVTRRRNGTAVRRRKPEERRAEILQAAARIFHATGYDNASLQDIADEVGIRKASLYHYFASKEETLNTLLAETAARGLKDIDRIGARNDPPLALLAGLIGAHVLRLCRNPMETQFFLHAYRRTPPAARRMILADDYHYREAFTRTITAGIGDGVFESQIDANLASIWILGAANWIASTLEDGPAIPDQVAIAREYVALSLTALAA